LFKLPKFLFPDTADRTAAALTFQQSRGSFAKTRY